VKPKKYLGQHFLTNLVITEQIADSIKSIDIPILEVGPGKGVLSGFLKERFTEFKAIELDLESVEYLKNEKILSSEQIVFADFLKVDFTEYFDKQFIVAGNFPYNISTQIVFKILDNKETVPEMVGMFQKEVAHRIASPHGSKQYGIMSVITQAYYNTEVLFDVPPESFYPAPKVISTIIQLTRKSELPDVDFLKLKRVVKGAFSQRRKTLRNALRSSGLEISDLTDVLLAKRAEQLKVQQFIDLTNQLFPTK
jgi:16S rRNA (adenine1518-N6/adenine1519-N6)-dimethyltransferase|tara:strand:- start:24671 stop:25429 length:759 start_codon:yes stop_codon:yes gene_type:complete